MIASDRSESTCGVVDYSVDLHQIWECRIRDDADGSAEQDWLEAERQLQNAEDRVQA